MSFDISDTLAPTSDQLDGIELAPGPRIFTVERVTKGSAEQPVQVHFVEFPRPWRPAKNMRRVLAECWGTESSEWTGRRVKLYYDPSVTFGKEQPGGTRIAALSHIDKPKKVPQLITRGKSGSVTIEPLSEPTTDERIASLRAEFRTADEARKVAILAEVETLQGAAPSVPVAHKFTGDADACTAPGCGLPVDAECHDVAAGVKGS